MKRFLSMVVLAALTLFVAGAMAAEMKGMKAAAKPTTLKGEIVDTGCYLGHGKSGADHKSCASRCIANGMPMGLLTADGKLYLLTPNHDNADPYTQLKDLAARVVEVTGVVYERGGMRSIDVTDLKAGDAK
ncbi:MAG: hypothetical protein HZC42_12995 [Candidatus Eisenbacteria bacterium]|nr:hypothetical protein [Candidatus Eisenbacteria bacterium]